MPHKDPKTRAEYFAAYNRKWREKNIDKARNTKREWYKKNRLSVLARQAAYVRRNLEATRLYARNHAKELRAELNDVYVKQKLVEALGVRAADIADNLVQKKREQLLLYRTLKEAKRVIKQCS